MKRMSKSLNDMKKSFILATQLLEKHRLLKDKKDLVRIGNHFGLTAPNPRVEINDTIQNIQNKTQDYHFKLCDLSTMNFVFIVKKNTIISSSFSYISGFISDNFYDAIVDLLDDDSLSDYVEIPETESDEQELFLNNYYFCKTLQITPQLTNQITSILRRPVTFRIDFDSSNTSESHPINHFHLNGSITRFKVLNDPQEKSILNIYDFVSFVLDFVYSIKSQDNRIVNMITINEFK